MKKFVFLFLVGVFLLNKNVYAMDSGQFRMLENLSNTPPATIRKTLKVGAAEVFMGASLVALSPYVPSLGTKHSSQNWNNRGDVSSTYDLLSPITLKVFGKTLVLNGARKFISAAHEEYNILRGSRLQPSERSLFLDIKNGVMDLGLASFIYVSHQHIPTLLMDSYVELAGPAVTVVAISYFGMRGLTGLARDLPTWIGELDWSTTAHGFKEMTVSSYSRFASLVRRKPQAPTH